jgi:hypothetical protein
MTTKTNSLNSILAYHFNLVTVNEEDKSDLEWLCANYDGETAGRWLNRMTWERWGAA